jgi:hypothetical protein
MTSSAAGSKLAQLLLRSRRLDRANWGPRAKGLTRFQSSLKATYGLFCARAVSFWSDVFSFPVLGLLLLDRTFAINRIGIFSHTLQEP